MSVQVVCPHCGKTTKLRDRSLLGKRGKCPGCGKAFVLNERQAPPESKEEVSLQLASSQPSQGEPLHDEPLQNEPLTGTGARWVPDEPPVAPAASPVASPVPVAYVPVQTPQGIVLAPVLPGQAPVIPASVSGVPVLPMPGAVSTQLPTPPPSHRDDPFAFDLDAGGATPSPTLASQSPASVSGYGRSARRKKSSLALWTGIGMAALVLGGVAVWLGTSTSSNPASTNLTATQPSTNTGAVSVESTPVGAYSRETLTADPTKVAEFRPTQGEPIPLNMLTGTNNVVIHMRPDRIWGTDRASAELKASLTDDVVKWLESTIERITRRKPEQIDELLIGISVVSKVEPPLISTVFRLKSPEKRSTLIQEFNGEEVSPPGKPLVTRKDQFAFHIKDDRTIAICPADMADELADAVAQPLDCVTEGIGQLLKSSDRERSLTIALDVTDATTYSSQLFEPSVVPACLKVLEWFGPEAETVSWSLHTGKYLHSELRVRPKGARTGTGKVSTPESLKQDYTSRIERTIELDLVKAVRQMRPSRAGFRQIIGRFPAMVEAFRQASISQINQSTLTITTVLPTKAMTNLALGTVLTWDESTRTDFSADAPGAVVADASQDLPKTVMARLKTEFEIEFSRKPLADAFAYLGEESKVTFVVDGDALKMAGYTKNMPQTFSLGKASASQGIYTIITWPMQEKLCLVVDDAKMEAKITTLADAEAKGLKVVPTESLK